MLNKSEYDLITILKKYLPDLEIKKVNTLEDLKNLGHYNLKAISDQIQEKHPELKDIEALKEKIQELKKDEWELLCHLVEKAMAKEKAQKTVETAKLLHKKQKARAESEAIYQLLTLNQSPGIKSRPLLPIFRGEGYLGFFNHEFLIYLPSIYKKEELKRQKQKWAYAHLKNSDDRDSLTYAFNFNVLNKQDWQKDDDSAPFITEINNPEILSISEFVILRNTYLSNSSSEEKSPEQKFMDIWLANCELSADLDIQEYVESIKSGTVAGKRKENLDL